MTITSFDSIEHLNQYCYTNFINSDPLRNSDYNLNFKLYPLDSIAADVIINGNYSFVRSYAGSYTDFVTNYINTASSSEILRILELYSSYTEEFPVYLYPYSRKDFIETYFVDLVPTLSSSVFDLLKSTGRINQIGAGQGKALVIKPSLLTEEHLSSLPSVKSTEEIISSINSELSLLTQSLSNTEYLMNKIAEKDQVIESLQAQILELNSKINQAYQTTWR